MRRPTSLLYIISFFVKALTKNIIIHIKTTFGEYLGNRCFRYASKNYNTWMNEFYKHFPKGNIIRARLLWEYPQLNAFQKNNWKTNVWNTTAYYNHWTYNIVSIIIDSKECRIYTGIKIKLWEILSKVTNLGVILVYILWDMGRLF